MPKYRVLTKANITTLMVEADEIEWGADWVTFRTQDRRAWTRLAKDQTVAVELVPEPQP